MLVNRVKIQVAPSRDRDLGKVSHTRGCFDFRKDQHESRAYPGTRKKALRHQSYCRGRVVRVLRLAALPG